MAAKDDAAAERARRRPGGDACRRWRASWPTSSYHALVLCAERCLAPADVIAVLRERHAAG